MSASVHADSSRWSSVGDAWSTPDGSCGIPGCHQPGFTVRCLKAKGYPHKSSLCAKHLQTAPAECARCEHEARVESRVRRSSTKGQGRL